MVSDQIHSFTSNRGVVCTANDLNFYFSNFCNLQAFYNNVSRNNPEGEKNKSSKIEFEKA